MSWRWISIAALLAALVIGYGAFINRRASPMASRETPRQPGYYLNDAVITQTQENGALGIRFIAERMEQRPGADAITITNVRVNYFQAPQKEWVLTAQRGLAAAESRVIQFSGDVELRPAEAADTFLRTDALAVDTERNIAYSVRSPAHLRFGQHRLHVRDFSADLNTEKLRMESVSGAYEPG